MRFVTLLALVAALAFPSAAQTAQSLIITGVADGPLPGGLPKLVELYVAEDIPDLSRYGVGSANNGQGTDGAEFVFPADAATAGSFLHISTPGEGVAAFESFFGFAPDYSSGMASINGDDAVELFFDANDDDVFDASEVTDVFGDINASGTGTPWEYLDGWAYRVNDTGPDGSTFVLANWTFSGVDGLEGGTTNATTNVPFPIGTYTRQTVSTEDAPSAALALTVANPVAGTAVVRYVAPTPEVALTLFDVTGRRVAALDASAGTATLDARALAPGAYVLRMEAGNQVLTRLVSVVR